MKFGKYKFVFLAHGRVCKKSVHSPAVQKGAAAAGCEVKDKQKIIPGPADGHAL